MKRAGEAAWLVLAMLIAAVPAAEARITLRPHLHQQDELFFHAHYSEQPFDPRDDFALQIWNCASGAMPISLALADPIVVCRDASPIGYGPATLVYSVFVPGGSCVDHGRTCYYRNRSYDPRVGGLRFFRVRYSSGSRGNRVWLESTGDLSAADQANMLFIIEIAGQPRAVLEAPFVPLPSGGWFSEF